MGHVYGFKPCTCGSLLLRLLGSNPDLPRVRMDAAVPALELVFSLTGCGGEAQSSCDLVRPPALAPQPRASPLLRAPPSPTPHSRHLPDCAHLLRPRSYPPPARSWCNVPLALPSPSPEDWTLPLAGTQLGPQTLNPPRGNTLSPERQLGHEKPMK